MLARFSATLRRLAAPVLCVFAAAAILPRTAAADWGSGVPVSTMAMIGGHDQVQLLRPTPTELLVVWRLIGGTTRHCRAQRMTDGGAPVWAPEGAGISASGWVLPFPATVDGTGGVFVAQQPPGDVFFEAVRGDGSLVPPLANGWPVATTTANEVIPFISSDGAGGAFVGWIQSSGTYLKRFESDGSLAAGWPAAGLPLPLTSPAFAPPAIAADGSGGAYVVCLSGAARVQRVTSGGTIAGGWPSGGLVLAVLVGNGVHAEIFPSGTGWIAVWLEQHFGPASARVVMQRFLSDGTIAPGWEPAGFVALDQEVSVGVVRFVSDGLGGVTVLWEQSGLPRVLHVLSNGTFAPGYPGTGISPLDAGAQYASTPDVGFAAATGGDGGVIFVWDDTRPSRPGLRARWLQADGTIGPAEPDSGRVPTPAGASVKLRAAIDDGSAGVYVAWEEGTYPYLLKMNRLASTALVDVEPAPAPDPAFALHAPSPNPASRRLTLRLALPNDTPACLDLLDLAGRRVRTQEVAGAGERTVSFDGLERVAPGMYWLRLTHGAATRSVRVAIAH